MKTNIWIPIDKVKDYHHNEFLVKLPNQDIGMGYKEDINDIIYVILKHDKDNVETFFPDESDYVLPAEIMFFPKFSGNSKIWHLTEERSNKIYSKLILGYNRKWINSDIGCNGIRLGYFQEDRFISLTYDNAHNSGLKTQDEDDDYDGMFVDRDKTYRYKYIVYYKYYSTGNKIIKGCRPNMPMYWRFIDN